MISTPVFVLFTATVAMVTAAAVPQYAAAATQYAAAQQYAAPQYAAAPPQYAAALQDNVPLYDVTNEDFVIDMDEKSTREDVIFPRPRRAALVLDRLLVALQKALHDPPKDVDDGPRAAPLRYLDTNEMTGLQRRGQGMSRGRVLRCYFNAITCF
ncbi:uncharacterized protein LOC121733180 [Aricia agestis]|uniref:uncharacterized protein LOC121733180 n=1 Tax=Aricia agestis TaxID=91739 RepID=UPI001C207607|nr:uncharacterized protein LOC121733180 [Aricia agestis]